jgi:hypothetical protein
MATKTAAEDGLKVLWMSIQLSSMLRTVDDAKESCRSIGPTDWVILLV